MQSHLIKRLIRLAAAIWWPLALGWLGLVAAVICDQFDLVWLPPDILAKDLSWLPAWSLLWDQLMAAYSELDAVGLVPLSTRAWPLEGIPLSAPIGLAATLFALWSTAAAWVMLRAQQRLGREQMRALFAQGEAAEDQETVVVEPVFHGSIVESLEARLFESEETLGQANERLLAARQALLNASLQPDGVQLPEDLAAARASLDGLEQELAALRGQQHALMAGLVNLATDGR